MTIEEISRIKITFDKPRSDKIWNLDKNKVLRDAIEGCLRTGVSQFVDDDAGGALYQLIPEYPLVETAMARPENKTFLKVRVKVFTPVFTLGVRQGEQR